MRDEPNVSGVIRADDRIFHIIYALIACVLCTKLLSHTTFDDQASSPNHFIDGKNRKEDS